MKENRNIIYLSISVSVLAVAVAAFLFHNKSVNNVQEEKKAPEIMYVSTMSGLVLRKSPGVGGEKIETITYSAPVEILEKSESIDTISGRSGNWVRIRWNRNYYFSRADPQYREGWCFSGFLSGEQTRFSVPWGVTVGTQPRTGRYEMVYLSMENSLEDLHSGGQSTTSLVFSEDGTISYEEYSDLGDVDEKGEWIDCSQYLRKNGTYRFKGLTAKAVYRKYECNFSGEPGKIDRQKIDEEEEYLFCETPDKYLVTDGGRLFFSRK